ncbi:LuxR C-terminal-related transcriptional regulator [Nonomuraea sp. NPDC000554]|uniref:helix-turn-helix transcriptional regulator n=1 Tax=Nonomuraea sp. NPDC000554 TaxID=3154259 RepID=UPI00331B3520
MTGRAKGNLPAEYSSFVGRASEVAEGLAALSESRLLTVTGPGGVGKSRLAAVIARQARRRFPGGLWYAELSSVTAERALIGQVAGVLGRPEVSTSEGVAAVLRGHRALLVLDTCEHLSAPVSRLVETVLRWTPDARIVATARRPPGVDGQRVLHVRPLPVGDAVTLFAERAAAVDPGFELTGQVRDTVAELCRRLDGLPLAVELAAACLRSLSAAELLGRLRERRPLPAAGTTSALPRQRDLRALVDWSHELCGAEQRALWAALSVLEGEFELEVAEAVGVDAGLPEARVTAVLGDLVDSSVLLRAPGARGVRYRMLEAFRQVGMEHLGERDRTRLAARYGAATRPGAGHEARPSGAPAEPVLSERELEVAVLIGQGLTNPQIADRLVISKRTVDAHVRNILAKGDLVSRTHVAAWVTASVNR